MCWVIEVSLWLWRSSLDAKRWKAGGSRIAAKTAEPRVLRRPPLNLAEACSAPGSGSVALTAIDVEDVTGDV